MNEKGITSQVTLAAFPSVECFYVAQFLQWHSGLCCSKHCKLNETVSREFIKF